MEEKLEQMGDKDVEVFGLDYEVENLLNGETDNKVYADASQETDETHLPFQDDTFDLVYSNHLMCQLKKTDRYDELFEQVKQGAERVLKDSGVEFHDC